MDLGLQDEGDLCKTSIGKQPKGKANELYTLNLPLLVLKASGLSGIIMTISADDLITQLAHFNATSIP